MNVIKNIVTGFMRFFSWSRRESGHDAPSKSLNQNDSNAHATRAATSADIMDPVRQNEKDASKKELGKIEKRLTDKQVGISNKDSKNAFSTIPHGSNNEPSND